MEEANTNTQKKRGGGKIVIAVLAILLVWMFSMSVVVTREDEYTLILAFGKVDREISKAGLSSICRNDYDTSKKDHVV